MRNVQKFLKNTSDADDLSVMEYNQCLAIVSASERMYMEFQGWRDSDQKTATIADTTNFFDEIDIKEERIIEQSIQENSLAMFDESDDEDNFSHDFDSPSIAEPATSQKKRRKRSPKWFSSIMKKCKNVIETESGPVDVWTCTICKNVTCRTYTGMRLHLTRIHSKELSAASSTKVNSTVVKQEDLEVIEEDFTPPRVYEASQKFEKNIDWIKVMVAKSKEELNNVWKCCICNNVTSASGFGMQLHITRMHCEKSQRTPLANATITAEEPLNGSSIEQPPEELAMPMEIQKYEKNPEWIKQMIEQSRAKDRSLESWTCCICRSMTCKTLHGIRLHIIRIHCEKGKSPPIEIPTSNIQSEDEDTEEIHERDPEWINEMAEMSKVKDDIWTCCLCENVTSRSMHGIKLHIVRVHCEPREDTQFVGDYVESEDDDISSVEDGDSDYGQTNIVKAGKREKESEWIKDVIEKSKTKSEDGSYIWVCSVCKAVKSKSYSGMKMHIVRMHRKGRKRLKKSKKYGETSHKRSLSVDEIDEEVEKFKKNCTTAGGSSSLAGPRSENRDLTTVVDVQKHIKTEPTSKNNDDDGDTSDGSDKKSDLNKSDNKLLLKAIRQSKVTGSEDTSYECVTCKQGFRSYTGIRYHIMVKHLKNPDNPLVLRDEIDNEETLVVQKPATSTVFDQEPIQIEGIRGKNYRASELDEEEQNWVKDNIKKSKVKNQNQISWKCWLCRKSYSYYAMIRYHVITVHMPSWKLGPDEYTKHVDEYLKVIANLANHSQSTTQEEAQLIVKQETMELPDAIMQQETICDVGTEEIQETSTSDTPRGKFMKSCELGKAEKKWLKQNLKKSRLQSSSTNLWDCWICHKKYSSYSTLRYHLMVSHMPHWKLGETSFTKHIVHCRNMHQTIVDKNIKNNKQILQTDPESVDTIRCNLCDYQFLNNDDYKTHMNIHMKTDPIAQKLTLEKCNLCPKVFKSAEDLSLHVSHHEAGVKCDLIPAKRGLLAFKSNVENPITESENCIFTCGHCEKKYETELDINRHLMLYHMSPFICPLDKREFYHAQPLIMHLTSSHFEVLGLKATCSHCNIEFKDNFEKLAHLRICENKPYECDFCPKRFGIKQSLLNHLKKELNIKEFSCHKCGKCFVTKQELTVHMNSHTSKVS